MITVGMNYRILPGKEKAFETVFAKVLEVMTAMTGHAQSHLFRDVFDPQSYLIISEWTDKAAFDAFTASDRFKSVTTWGKEQILATRPKHEIYGLEQSKPPGACPVPH